MRANACRCFFHCMKMPLRSRGTKYTVNVRCRCALGYAPGRTCTLRRLPLVNSTGAVAEGEQGVVLAAAHVLTGMEMGAALTNDDVAGGHVLAAELLDAQTLCVNRGRYG